MGAKVGLIGLPNAGKSSLFNALARANAQVAPYPFTTIDQNVGVAAIDDPRLQRLAAVVPHDKIVPTSLDVVDIAGLVKGAHQGEGLGNQFLSHVLAVDALVQVVRCFSDADVPHPMGEVDPARDVEIVNTELLLKDLELVERRLEKERKLAKGGDKQAQSHVERLGVVKAALEQGTPVRRLGLDDVAHPRALSLELLSAKPVIYVANVDEAALREPTDAVKRLAEIATREKALLISLCVRLEAELVELEAADRAEMIRELGLEEAALPRIVREAYQALALLTFFTTASRMLQAWTVARGTHAPQAAGAIHTDFERNFIRAEVIPWETLVNCGGEAQARAKGVLRLEGKDYEVRDGDVIHFKVGA